MNLKESAVIFPGQGSQYVGMLSEYFKQEASFTRVFHEASEFLGINLTHLVASGSTEDLSKTTITQPLMLTSSYAIWKCLGVESSQVKFMAGHSLGEFTALVASEAIDFQDALNLVSKRAKYMQESVPEGQGGIAAIIGLDKDSVERVCNKINLEKDELVSPANLNSINQIVISGTSMGVSLAIEELKEIGAKRAITLPMSVPSHCKLMIPAAEKFKKDLDSVNISLPKSIVLHNFSASSSKNEEELRSNLIKQLYNPVRWEELILSIIKLGVESFVECGPSKVLTGLSKKIDKEKGVFSLDSYENYTKNFKK